MPLLQKESKGDILISLEYQPKQCVLDGMILKVTNLEKQDVSGLAGLKIHLKHRILPRLPHTLNNVALHCHINNYFIAP